MSVVNKMLRDLESREQPPIDNANYVPSKPRISISLVIVSISVLLVLIASYSIYVLKVARPSPTLAENLPTIEAQRDIQYTQDPQTSKSLTAAPKAIQNHLATKVNTPPLPNDATINLAANKPPIIVTPQLKPLKNSQFNVAPSDGAKNVLSNLRAKAHLASQQNDDNQVVAILQEILLLAPQETRTRKQLAALLFSNEQLSSAQQVLSSGIAHAPNDSSLRLMLSRIFFKTGDFQQAFTTLADHPSGSIANDELLSFRAALAEKIGEYSLAQQDYQILVQRNPGEAKWWLGLGVSQDKQKLSKQAINSYQQAQSLKQLPPQVDNFMLQRIQVLARPS